METLNLPCLIFQTQRKWNDVFAADMRCGDLNANQLRQQFYLTQVSDQVDPFALKRLTPFDAPQHRFTHSYPGGRGESLSPAQCAALLFDEMRSLSWPFSLYGPYRQLINRMIDHMQYGFGMPFHDAALNMALKQQILSDKTPDSSLLKIKETISNYTNYNQLGFENELVPRLNDAVRNSVLPKFSRGVDYINGLGITVHDIYAVRISLLNLHISPQGWEGKLRYEAQDHFGLDDEDIQKKMFHQFTFFRIWFVLQRYKNFAFRPFMTNMEAVITIEGKRA